MSDHFPVPYIAYSLEHLRQLRPCWLILIQEVISFYFCFHRHMKKYSRVRLERDFWTLIPSSYVSSSSSVLKLVRILFHYHVVDLFQIALLVT